MPSEKVSDGIFSIYILNLIAYYHCICINLNFLEFQYKTPSFTTLIPPKINSAIPCLTNHWQTLQSHSVNVGEMAAEFARVFGAQEQACQTGKLHDLGKYSEPFNRRLHGSPSVDHATAGAKLQKCLLYSEFQSISCCSLS